jgi:predicted ArsR family transcriptional regulator
MNEPDDLWTLAPVHNNDPTESAEAARKVDAAGQLRQVMVCLLEHGAMTDDQIAQRCGLLRTSAGTRRGIAVKLGYVEKVGRGMSVMGNPCGVWSLTAAGEAEARRLREARAA